MFCVGRLGLLERGEPSAFPTLRLSLSTRSHRARERSIRLFIHRFMGKSPSYSYSSDEVCTYGLLRRFYANASSQLLTRICERKGRIARTISYPWVANGL